MNPSRELGGPKVCGDWGEIRGQRGGWGTAKHGVWQGNWEMARRERMCGTSFQPLCTLFWVHLGTLELTQSRPYWLYVKNTRLWRQNHTFPPDPVMVNVIKKSPKLHKTKCSLNIPEMQGRAIPSYYKHKTRAWKYFLIIWSKKYICSTGRLLYSCVWKYLICSCCLLQQMRVLNSSAN